MNKKKETKANVGGRPKSPKRILREIVPVDALFDTDEKKLYTALIDIYIKDFDEDELSYGDIDDIMTIALNKVLEVRLLKSSKGSADRQIDISTSLEKLRKQTEKIKDNLATRRRDRINPNELKGFSIVDLAVAFDIEKRTNMLTKVDELKKEQKETKQRLLEEFPGNRHDIDGDINKENEDI